MKLANLPDVFEKSATHGFFEDFDNDIDSNEWVVVATDSGTGAVGDAAKGILPLVASDGTVADNDETYVKKPNETFLFAENKDLIFEAYVQFTEANTDDANVWVGIKDAIAANTIVDDGAGPPSSYSGAGFFKVDGGTNWNVEVSIGTTQTTYELTAANSLDGIAKTAGGSAYQKLRIIVRPFSSTQADAMFFIDDVLVRRITFTYTNASEMQPGAGVKNGGANLETLNIDYMACYQVR